ncbi:MULTISPECIES: DNA polymerase III subunit delta' [unclassified Aeromicrobium]|uniref:DNA polymerase III subunit delta' n=1 Tax=unclassified Aeromicrobium TaxID=2633570 RepID=UPI0006F3E021|nr:MULTISPECIES: DNA polymerase III subunit delta' [unclassified Aeromicrobium]KQO42130.1 DNA polymerase III subunit delta' [Aeromicrobium sp. Leaf245]KQP29320.1 DNA polymerase III subunit delta' [Aeromicrobium sp. Leaf272]KQP75611.1 DNA polymerase III subunit delta' [Aeromicrobium sp. Leaf289]
MTSVWDELVGQGPVVDTLSAAVRSAGGDGRSMTHAWLLTGPPGSGRSNAAKAFAAALQCELGGCGQCHSCTTAAAGSHPDITVIRTDGLSIGTDVAREYVRKSALRPALGRWQVLIVEDADRLTEQAANALLKAVEEPSQYTVWMLCAPATEDVIVTIRSRCRAVLLRTPPADAIARLLVERDGVEPQLAQAVAAASQGHIGRARGLARDPQARERRRDILSLPTSLRSLGDCLVAAQRINDEATARAAAVADVADERETSDLKQSWGVEDRGRRPAGYAGAVSSLEKDQKRRRTRLARDSIDGVLLDLLSFCRDVVVAQTAPGAPLVNADVADAVRSAADVWTPDSTLRRIDAIVEAREALTANAAPLLTLERMMMGFRTR